MIIFLSRLERVWGEVNRPLVQAAHACKMSSSALKGREGSLASKFIRLVKIRLPVRPLSQVQEVKTCQSHFSSPQKCFDAQIIFGVPVRLTSPLTH